MPRRHRRRRLEWTNSMQSDTTLVDFAVEPATNSTTQTQATASPNDIDANTRPSRIRSAAPGLLQGTEASVSHHDTAFGDQPIVQQSAPVTRSDSEQTTAGTASNGDAKTQYGLGRRIKESISRRLRLFSASFIPSDTNNRSHGTDGYYAVSLY
ncbi:hypothetical protein IW140_003758 [Coemansia sp. RSA 1813]|nr:hypothetical protein EV178_003527 [Coemansia sp. RSA 1646]KAJ1772788.1 hypothetical protein LPJ74_001127 [Coemansia sp. RSA 1843]KAJ2088653.1 hypothetical protein IW138_004035 [Coemansia sp. RSA 986]KAJ2213140.1 hypothetical protein EV179_004110 [Coemansia sp. RSA 487]KAJ2568552.1 hypothetical protein IW140_003758 [Coemansia sp. RSA 1813]